MPTNEERKERAAMLRKVDMKKYYKSIGAAIEELEAAIGCGYAYLPYRLADLIEPEERTCRVVRKTTDIDGERTTDYTCCFNQPGWNNNFCPNCGARVEEEA